MGYPIFQGLSLKPRQNSSLNFNRAEQTFLVFSLITHEEINILLFDVLMILGKLKISPDAIHILVWFELWIAPGVFYFA